MPVVNEMFPVLFGGIDPFDFAQGDQNFSNFGRFLLTYV